MTAMRQNGFTLIELMTTVAVLGVLLSVAIPSYRTMVLNNRMAAQSNQVIAAFNYARSEAVKRATRTTVCPTEDGATCAASTNWSTGWMVFSDTDGDGTVDAGETIVRVWPAIDSGTTLNAGRVRITYTALGFATGFNDTLRLCDARGSTDARAITVNAMGRAYTNKGTTTCP